MTTVGVIAEYNPFHNGHLLQLREIRRRFPDAGIIVAMSGSFTQRGTVAILDKWSRAEAAVRHGASLVLELPVVFATRSAQYFASGGVRLFDRLGVVDLLAFGSECDNLVKLQSMRKKIEAAEATLKRNIPRITNKECFSEMTIGRMAWLKSRVINPNFSRFAADDSKYRSTEKCIHCGKCVKACPLQNITLEDGRPVWHGHCTICMACYHQCPVNAIQYGKATEGKGQYYYGMKDFGI